MPRLPSIPVVAALALATLSLRAASGSPRPNIVWITSEDHGPHLGCYGDAQASTPHLDQLAARSLRYTRVWSCAPVCAPARTTLISGLYPTSTGAEHMRSLVPCPEGKPLFPQMLRAAGYYCVNNAKEDYNLAKPGQVWDDSSRRAHWTNRAPGQPFFAVFNSEKSHESRIRARPHPLRHDPAALRIPSYHPDTPEVRHDWAQYYDIVSEADADAGNLLRQLEADGRSDDTIVFYFADHGSGMPRSKRSACNSGLQVPLIVHIPPRYAGLRPPEYRPGGTSDRLVSFVDFAPTVLSLAGIRPPTWLQGRAFLGPYRATPPAVLHGFRGRMDERPDLVRSVTDGRFVYVRNYQPHLIPGQHVEYMFQTPTTRIWKDLHDRGQLTPVQDAFWNPKPPEELYDLLADPDETRNLATSPSHQRTLRRLRTAQQNHARAVRDVGFVPEGDRHVRCEGMAPYDFGHDRRRYPFARIFAAAEQASSVRSTALSRLRRAMGDSDPAVRYWGVQGMLVRGTPAVLPHRDALVARLQDPSTEVRIAAAEALARYASPADRARVLPLLASLADPGRNDVFTATAALLVLDALDEDARPTASALARFPSQAALPDARYNLAVPRLLGDLRERLGITVESVP